MANPHRYRASQISLDYPNVNWSYWITIRKPHVDAGGIPENWTLNVLVGSIWISPPGKIMLFETPTGAVICPVGCAHLWKYLVNVPSKPTSIKSNSIVATDVNAALGNAVQVSMLIRLSVFPSIGPIPFPIPPPALSVNGMLVNATLIEGEPT